MHIVTMENFKQQLIQTINNSNLSVGAAYYILKDVLSELKMVYDQTLEDEIRNNVQDPLVVTEEIDVNPEVIDDSGNTILINEELKEEE